MGRLGRHLLALCSAVSLLLCVAVGALWARSNLLRLTRVELRCSLAPQADERHALSVTATSFEDTLTFTLSHNHFPPAHLRALTSREMYTLRDMHPLGLSGSVDERVRFGRPPTGLRARRDIHTGATGYRADTWVLAVHHWMAMALLLVIPAIWLHRLQKWHRAQRLGFCPACGYDLRATPERCPECGAVPTATTLQNAAA